MDTIQVRNERLFTQKEIADAGIMSTVKQWEERKAGRLKCYRIGSKVLYGQSHIDAYFAANEQKGQSTGNENLEVK